MNNAPVAILVGSSLSGAEHLNLTEETVNTPYGNATLQAGKGKEEGLYVLVREGLYKEIPPHLINYRANVYALYQKGIKRIIALYEVGSINLDIPPKTLTTINDILDFTRGRATTFFDGGEKPVRHVDMSHPFCWALNRKLIDSGPEFDFILRSNSIYVSTQGPRLSTPAEINMYRRLGGDVVGMSGMPEITLIRELGMSVAALSISINWAPGIQPKVSFDHEGLDDVRARVFKLSRYALSQTQDSDCVAAAIH